MLSKNGPSEREVFSRSRPIRIAYLVELTEDSHPILDAIFHSAKRYWGGRFSLIVPCENGMVRDGYREWLRAYDPDFIYSYVDLTPEARLGIHEQIYPAYLMRHPTWGNEEETDRHRFRPSLPVEPLSTSTIIPILSRRSDFGGERTLRVVSGAGEAGDSPFFRDNFGVELSLENDLNGRLSEFGSISLVDEREPNPRALRGRSERVFASVSDLLTSTGRDRRTTTPMRLAAALAPRLEMRQRRWSHSFNLVVGDTLTDRIVYWNARFAYPQWRDGDQVDLRLPAALSQDAGFLESVAQFLRESPPVSGDNSGGTPIVTIRSSSLGTNQLEAVKLGLVHGKSWVHYEVDAIASVDDCVPSLDRRQRMLGGLALMRGLPTGTWQRAIVTGDLTVVQAEPPDHLRHCPPTLQTIHEGLWAVDVSIERKVNYSRHSNITDTWRLPRRLRTTGSFTGAYQVGLTNGQHLMPRASLGGFLTLFTGGRGALPVLSEPTDEQAITYALTAGRDWWPFLGQDDERAVQLCFVAERSNAGRYFWGSVQLLGGLQQASEFLLHRFWREQLVRFGATDQRPEQRLSDIQTRLKRRLPRTPFDLKNDAALARLSNIVLQEADAIRLTTQSLSWKELQEAHGSYVEAEWEAHPPSGDLNLEEWTEHDRNSLRHAVQSLCVRGVLHQGVEHTCRHCHHLDWVTIEALGREIRCDICGRTEAAPVNRPWDFRLNGFLRDALRSHGVGPLFWALDRMRQIDNRSFWFEGPLNIYLSKEEYDRHQPTTDTDLTVITDGIVRMCEVKQSARNLTQLETFADLMKKLRPDIATIAVMEPSTRTIRDTFERFAKSLKGTGIEPELIAFEPDRDLRDQAYLGPLHSFRIF